MSVGALCPVITMQWLPSQERLSMFLWCSWWPTWWRSRWTELMWTGELEAVWRDAGRCSRVDTWPASALSAVDRRTVHAFHADQRRLFLGRILCYSLGQLTSHPWPSFGKGENKGSVLKLWHSCFYRSILMFLMREGLQCRISILKIVWWGYKTILISWLLFSPLPKLGQLSVCDVSWPRESGGKVCILRATTRSTTHFHRVSLRSIKPGFHYLTGPSTRLVETWLYALQSVTRRRVLKCETTFSNHRNAYVKWKRSIDRRPLK